MFWAGALSVGGTAGAAAGFSTPLADVALVTEEMSRSFDRRTSGIVVTAVILAGLTAMAILGSYQYFGYSEAAITAPRDWLAIPICAVVGVALGVVPCGWPSPAA